MMMGYMIVEKLTVPKRLANRSLMQIFAMGMSAPSLIAFAPTVRLRALRRGETIEHAWGSVGHHLTRAMSCIADEQRRRS